MTARAPYQKPTRGAGLLSTRQSVASYPELRAERVGVPGASRLGWHGRAYSVAVSAVPTLPALRGRPFQFNYAAGTPTGLRNGACLDKALLPGPSRGRHHQSQSRASGVLAKSGRNAHQVVADATVRVIIRDGFDRLSCSERPLRQIIHHPFDDVPQGFKAHIVTHRQHSHQFRDVAELVGRTFVPSATSLQFPSSRSKPPSTVRLDCRKQSAPVFSTNQGVRGRIEQ